MKPFKCLFWPNESKEEAIRIARRLIRYLDRQGGEAFVRDSLIDRFKDEPVRPAAEAKPEELDLLVPMGGDGTIIGSVRRYKNYQIPLLGINLGDLGFLAEVEPSEAEEALQEVLDGLYRIEERILLEGRIIKTSGEEEGPFTALNEVMINRHMMASLIRMSVYINDQFIDSFSGDGLIVCTPTGSTAYNLSAGGPIVAPSARNLVITPVCVHSLNVRSIVTSEEDQIRIVIGESKGEAKPSIISIDGQKNEWLEEGDHLILQRSERTVPLIKVKDHSFYETLKEKMF